MIRQKIAKIILLDRPEDGPGVLDDLESLCNQLVREARVKAIDIMKERYERMPGASFYALAMIVRRELAEKETK